MALPKIIPLPYRHISRFRALFRKAVEQHFAYFPDSYRQQVLRDHSFARVFAANLDPRRTILVAYDGSQMIGYAVGSLPKDGRGQLYWLYIEPEHRGGNTGLALMSRMIRLLGEQGATEVQLVTYDHRKYYQRQGFKFVKQVRQQGLTMDVMTFQVKRT